MDSYDKRSMQRKLQGTSSMLEDSKARIQSTFKKELFGIPPKTNKLKIIKGTAIPPDMDRISILLST